MSRRLVRLASAFLAWFLALAMPVPALAAGGHLSRLLLVLVPHGRQLAVFEDAEFSQPLAGPAVGILDGAGPVSASAPVVLRQGNQVVIGGTRPDVILRYTVPWNGRGGTLNLPFYEPADTLVVLAAPGLSVPSVLNPSLAAGGRVRLTAGSSAPVFNVFSTSGLAQGENLPIVVEAGSAALPVPAPALPPQYPVLGRALLAAALAVALGGLAWAFNWVPVTARRQEAAAAWERELADLEAAREQGVVPDGEYRVRRRALERRLATVGEDRG
ncbi:conserved exported protein of unknown function [Candidatus Hydrogenisulfobacillus filiaventi]|uniref:SHOCT domain-containing protein n=1 Tax=Candidatus Hydrogenisulfobacillus filiaventi TaxID=2707344 RepID=A0A6F8ZGS2_9FIRM|nr:hypothetical protein [Bacillota bacterium]CAB1128986.1 conserved exported protein of unknown function [Candidatus Hydrogenisulfobacillus filiaventi]